VIQGQRRRLRITHLTVIDVQPLALVGLEALRDLERRI
jgi:hypothetical protein